MIKTVYVVIKAELYYDDTFEGSLEDTFASECEYKLTIDSDTGIRVYPNKSELIAVLTKNPS